MFYLAVDLIPYIATCCRNGARVDPHVACSSVGTLDRLQSVVGSDPTQGSSFFVAELVEFRVLPLPLLSDLLSTCDV